MAKAERLRAAMKEMARKTGSTFVPFYRPSNPSPEFARLDKRWQEIAAELKELTYGKPPPYDPPQTEREAALLEEQDAIEYEIGVLALRCR